MRKSKSIRLSIGITLAMCGISIGGVLKIATEKNLSLISEVIVIASCLLMISSVNIKKIILSRNISGIFLYSIYTIMLAFFANQSFFAPTVGIVYQMVYFLQIFLLWKIDEKFDPQYLIECMYWILGISNIILCVCLIPTVVSRNSLSLGIIVAATDNAAPVSRATTGFLGFWGFIAALVYQGTLKKEKIIRIFFCTTSIFVIIISARRGIIIATILIVIIHMRNCGVLRMRARISVNRLIKGFLITISIVLILVYFYETNRMFQDAVIHTWESLVKGIRTYLGMGMEDLASSYRRQRLDTIPNKYLMESTVWQFIFGRGYNDEWLDIPFLQAFWDMGLVGGIWYFIIQGVEPILHLRHKSNNPSIMFAQYCVVLRVISNFANGTPYGGFLPIVLLFTLERIEKNSTNHNSDKDKSFTKV